MRLEIAALGIRLDLPREGAFGDGLPEWFHPFVHDSDDSADITIDVAPRRTSLMRGNSVFRIDSDVEDGRKTYRFARYCAQGVLRDGPWAGEITLGRNHLSLDAALRFVVNVLLPTRGGLLLHAASWVQGGVGHLVPGPSGAGKSTLTACSGGSPIFSDEGSLVRLGPEGFEVFGSPFHREPGIQPVQGRAPLGRIAFPDRSLPRGIHPLTTAQCLQRLLPCCINYCYGDAELDAAIVAVAAELAQAVPAVAVSLPRGMALEQALERYRC